MFIITTTTAGISDAFEIPIEQAQRAKIKHKKLSGIHVTIRKLTKTEPMKFLFAFKYFYMRFLFFITEHHSFLSIKLA
jgi:hypothetical protein